MLLGKEIEILMPNGEKRKGQFAVVELNNTIASHNHISFSSSKDYPTNEKFENINDRNYHDDPNAQAKVIDVAQNLEPSILLSTSRTPAGTPIISIDGFVVSGNNRTMSLKLASHKFPERYEAYKKMLLDECEAFGISRTDLTSSLMGEKILDKRNTSKPFQLQSENDLIKIENPVLVRFDYDFPAYNTLEISKYNKETKKSERPLDKAIKLSSILQSNIKLRDSICLMVGEHETLSEFYSVAKDQRQLINILVEGNLLTTQEKAAYLGDSGFNSAGKDLVEMILSSIVLDRDSLIASDTEGVKRLRGIIITSLPVLVRNASLPKGSLKETINRSIVLEKSIQTSGLSFGDYISQEALFEEKPERNVLIMNRLLDSGRNNFKKAIDSYNDSVSDNQGENLFGEKPGLNEIFFVHIEKRIDPKELSLINKFYPLKNKSADSDAQPSFFFEDHTSDRFLNEIRKFTFFDEFSRRYSELDLWIDVTDSAQLGIIRVADIIPMPGNDESKPINESFFKGLLDHIKSGKGMTPIVVERADSGYYLREGLFRLLAYKELAKEFIPALVYQNHVLSAKRDFANPDQLTIEDFLDITLDNLFRNARDKQTHSPDKKTYIGSYEGFKKVIPNVMIPISVRKPWCCRDIYVTDLMKEFKKGKFPDLKSLTNKDLPNLSPSQMFELLQFSHPTEYKIKIDRMDLLLEWEKRGKTIFEKLGFPTDINYPYVNVNTGYRSVYTLGHNINEERENVQWWACAQNNLPMGDLERGIEILDREINTLNEVQQTLIDPKTKKVKSRNKDLYNQNAFEINSYERGKLVISEYLKRSESDKSIKEKEAEAQIMIVNLLKKKLSLEKKKQK
ncbi:MAG: hypothetical protein NVV82_00305 [Sporocytophaga sp.]|nr:hypothetical protein [Sporocytophaga sp.]